MLLLNRKRLSIMNIAVKQKEIIDKRINYVDTVNRI